MNFLFLILLIYLALSVFYLLALSLFSLLPLKKCKPKTNKYNRFAILIPDYKENKIIIDVANSALQHNYPRELFDVYVIADGVEPTTVEKLKTAGVKVLEVKFENSTKAKSLNYALNTIEQNKYDYAVVLDVDNLMEKDFLIEMNNTINCGYKVVQGHRTAKNINTSTALLDAISEETANSMIRRGLSRIGGSAMIIGSAFAIEWNLFKRIMRDITDVAGEDRELEIRLLREKIKIAYCPKAIVYDEKVENWEIYTQQRSRWAAAHLDFVLKYTILGLAELFRGNFDYFNKVWHNLIPPRIILLSVLFILAALSYIFKSIPYFEYWLVLLVLYIIALMISIPKKFYTLKLLIALIELPKMFVFMLLSWIKAKGQRKKFVATPHIYTGDEN